MSLWPILFLLLSAEGPLLKKWSSDRTPGDCQLSADLEDVYTPTIGSSPLHLGLLALGLTMQIPDL